MEKTGDLAPDTPSLSTSSQIVVRKRKPRKKSMDLRASHVSGLRHNAHEAEVLRGRSDVSLFGNTPLIVWHPQSRKPVDVPSGLNSSEEEMEEKISKG